MAGTGRAIVGVVVTVAVALVLFIVVRGSGGSHPFGVPTSATPTASATVASSTAPLGSLAGSAPAAAGARATSPAPAAPAKAALHASPLSDDASAYLAGRSGTVIAAVYDIETGQSWRLGDGVPQDEASVVKLDVLETLLARQGSGLLAPADQVLAQAMIEDSDNDAATSLWDEAGGAGGIGAYNNKAGLTSTTPSRCVTCAGFKWPGWGLSTTLPQDQLSLLKQLVVPGRHPLLSAAQRSYALSLMENVKPDQAWGVSGGVPAGTKVALKNGWLPLTDDNTNWQVNSVGWVHGGGRNYLIAVLSTGNPTEQYGIDTINGLSSRVWSALG
jgi:hypothetical protein